MAELASYQNVADYFIALSNDVGDTITNLKLQKLVFYTQAFHLAIYDTPIFDEDFEAWVHGPVIKPLYAKYKELSYHPIEEDLPPSDELLAKMPNTVKDLLGEITEEYFGMTAFDLERLTHEEEPWINARKGLTVGERSDTVISKASMQSYYKQLLQ